MLRRKKPLTRRTRLRPVSKKRAAINKLRGEFVREQLARRPYCEVSRLFDEALGRFGASQPRDVQTWALQLARGCMGMSTELHEPLTRARAPGAETILDERNSVAICRNCHDWVHDHPAASTTLGLLRRAEVEA